MNTSSLTFEAIGTKWKIEYEMPAGKARLRSMISETIDKFDRSFSRFRHDSWVSTIRHEAGTYDLPDDAFALLELYSRAYAATNGLVTPVVGTLLEQAGYDADYSLRPTTLTPVPPFHTTVSFTANSVTTTSPVLFDFGAAGKGYLIDMIGALFRENGVERFVINAGGDLLHSDPNDTPIVVGLENPNDLTQAIATTELANASLCASAGSRRAWHGFTHIINPQTRESPVDVDSVWVKADSAAIADMIATALFFVPAQHVKKAFAFEYAVLRGQTELVSSQRFGMHAFTAGVSQ